MPDITLRDAMVIAGSLLILAVIIDALRRMRQQQRSRVKVKLAGDVPDDGADDDLSLYRELPNGGARVVRRDDGADAGEAADSAGRTGKSAKDEGAPVRVPGGEAPRGKASARSAAPSRDAGEPVSSSGRAPAEPAPAAPSQAGAPGDAQAAGDEIAPLKGMRASDDEPANLDWLEDLPVHDPTMEESPGELPRANDTDVVARDQRGFVGGDILEILLACDLRFGDMNFFHRHEQEAGRGPIQFSVANMLQPGVFDIDNMDAMRTRGLVFFVTLPGPEDMLQAFDYMLETARTVARNLGGELLDESRSVLTQQAVEHSRQQIRELERRLRAREA